MTRRTVLISLSLIAAVALPLTAAALTLQTGINGSEHLAMIDVGETQIVLNVWGTLHATGYPHYVVSASALTALLRGLGLDAAAAPAVTSWLFTGLALGLLGLLLSRLTGWVGVAAGVIAVYGLTRTAWLHASIAEIYAFTLVIAVGLYGLALWPGLRWRVGWLALLGGVGVAQHRALAMLIPALVIAAWPDVRPVLRRPHWLAGTLALGLSGFAAYAYLPLRETSGAAWVYGEPGTWAGLWDQITGREAARFIGGVRTVDGLIANTRMVTDVILTDLGGGAAGIAAVIVGVSGWIAAARRPELRRFGIAAALGGLTAYAFHCAAYTDVLAALIQIVTLSIAFGWAGLATILLRTLPRVWPGIALGAAAAALVLIGAHGAFISGLTQDRAAADEAIAIAADAPPGSTLMIPWGTRHFAVGFARDVQGRLPGITLVDHKADFAALIAGGGLLVTPDFTFYAQPAAWWADRLGTPPVVSAVAPRLIAVRTRAEIAPDPLPFTGVGVVEAALTCAADRLTLAVAWAADAVPQRDLAVFVHLLAADGTLIAQADQAAPVYGLRPLTSWQPAEIVRDAYALPRLDAGAAVRFGLYTQTTDGRFTNVYEAGLPVECAP